jgi:hypothetical protein
MGTDYLIPQQVGPSPFSDEFHVLSVKLALLPPFFIFRPLLPRAKTYSHIHSELKFLLADFFFSHVLAPSVGDIPEIPLAGKGVFFPSCMYCTRMGNKGYELFKIRKKDLRDEASKVVLSVCGLLGWRGRSIY